MATRSRPAPPSSRRRLLATGGAATAAALLARDPQVAGAATDVPDASDTTKGITKLSVAPASATDPIALGVNDPRVPPGGKVRFALGSGPPDGNTPLVLGWNQMPNYGLLDTSDRGLAWVIEPNYDDGSGHNKMEAYLQFLTKDTSPAGARRPFTAQLDKVTGEITETTITGGQSLSLRIHDGSDDYPDPDGLVGKQALSFTEPGRAFFGNGSATKTTVEILGKNDAGEVAELRLVDRASGQYFAIAQRATALSSALRIGFGDSDQVHIANNGNVGIGTAANLGAALAVVSPGGRTRGLVVRSGDAQSAFAQEWQGSDGTAYASVTRTGRVDVYYNDIYARAGQANTVGIGALGPSRQAGIVLQDSRLYRNGPLELRTDSSLVLGGDLSHQGGKIGFFGTPKAAKQTVSGSRGGNEALRNLLAALAAYGLIVDSTQA